MGNKIKNLKWSFEDNSMMDFQNFSASMSKRVGNKLYLEVDVSYYDGGPKKNNFLLIATINKDISLRPVPVNLLSGYIEKVMCFHNFEEFKEYIQRDGLMLASDSLCKTIDTTVKEFSKKKAKNHDIKITKNNCFFRL